MTDELETARMNMIVDGIEEENITRRTEAKFDLYSRSEAKASDKIEAYQEFIGQLLPYVEQLPAEEQEFLTVEEERMRFKKFVDLHARLAAGMPPKVE